MNESAEKKIKKLIHTIGLNNNLQDEEVKQIIEAQFRFTYETIRNLEFENLTDEEIDSLKKTFYYKYIGKLFTNSIVINRVKKSIEIRKEKINESRKSE